MSAFVGIYVI